MSNCDRLSRTIKEKIFKFFTDKNTSNWIDNLDDIVNSYNDTPHQSLKYITPNDVKDNIYFVQDLNKQKIKRNKT